MQRLLASIKAKVVDDKKAATVAGAGCAYEWECEFNTPVYCPLPGSPGDYIVCTWDWDCAWKEICT